MKKHIVDLVRGYVHHLPDDDFDFLHGRLRDRLGGDLGDALQFIQENPEMDNWLLGAKSAFDLYDMVDTIYQYVDCEVIRPTIAR